MLARRQVRVVLVAVVVVSSLLLAGAYVTRPTTTEAGTTDGVTVVTQQGRDELGGKARVLAFRPDGSVMYEDDRYGSYFDVDPVEGTRRTVEYVAIYFRPARVCPDRLAGKGDWCTRNYYIRANLSTGERRVVYDRFLPRLHKIHDIDRLNDTHLVVGNIQADSVEVVNTTSGEVTWEWNANESFAYPESGGTTHDWTHLNDVEVVRDGWVMVSLRNHDQVVFVDPGEGVVEDWTLGCDDCWDTLFEQHNPDYIPAERGGPAVVVADSENHRIVEFQREDGEWRETWTWTGSQVAWPRDADRLPDGRTLVTDSHANRVVEVAPNGSVVWSVTLGNPYEAERLGTGDESAGGRPHDPGDQLEDGDPVDRLLIAVRDALPPRLYSGAMFGMPFWVGIAELLLAASGAVGILAWLLSELFWFCRGRSLPTREDVRHGVDRLRDGVDRLRDGVDRLRDGVDRLFRSRER
jgi:X-X-X-Leu-X-X-Gly heptad repeat protein